MKVTKLKQLDKAFYEKYVSESGMYVNGQWMKSHPLYKSDSPKLTQTRRPRKAMLKENANDLDRAGDELVAGGGGKCPFCDKIYKHRVHRGRTENELLD